MEDKKSRALALDILMTAGKDAYLEDVLRKELDRNSISRTDRAFITRLAEGVTERRITLDQLIGRFSRTPVEKLRPVIRQCLRMGTYQLIYMDHVPDHAAINETIKLVKERKLAGLSGFVNAVLRKISMWKKDDPEGMAAWIKETPEREFSTPAWIVRRLEEEYGQETARRILADQFVKKPLTLRVNSTKTSRDSVLAILRENGIEAEKGELSGQAVRVFRAENPSNLPGWQEGLFIVQDESSMLAVEAAEIAAGESVLDLCAAPGGKTTYAAELSGGRVVSRDIAPGKVRKIEENLARLGLRAETGTGDAAVFEPRFTDDEKKGIMDLVIADVPCSGLGVIGKKNDIKYRLRPEDPKSLAEQGGRILDTAAGYVKPGGRLLFSTCTILPEENRENTAAFISRHPGFRLEKEKQLLQGVDHCDGFYYAVLRRENAR